MNIERISRRDFLIRSASLVLATACENIPFLEVKSEEKKENGLAMGDVILVGTNAYLLREGLSYPIPNLEEYKRRTKFDEYKRRILPSTIKIFDQYPQGRLFPEPAVIDPFTGDIKNAKKLGGEINIYFAGFMTDDGIPYDVIKPKNDTFVEIRRALAQKNWHIQDNLFFTYGEKEFNRYEARNTAKSPQENIQHAQDFLGELKKTFSPGSI